MAHNTLTYLPDVNAALVDVTLAVLLEDLTKEVNEKIFFRKQYVTDAFVLCAFVLGSENVGENRMSSEDMIGPRSLEYCNRQTRSAFSVGNQMGQAFTLEIFQEKGNTFRGIPLFSFSPKLLENHCTIYLITQVLTVPCSLVKIRDFARENAM